MNDFLLFQRSLYGENSRCFESKQISKEVFCKEMGYYLIDGYNLLFSLQKKRSLSLEKERACIVEELDELLSILSLKAKVVFDSQEQLCDYAPSAHKHNLSVIYAPRGYSADDYILELLEDQPQLYLITVVTSDGDLQRLCRPFRVKILSIEQFLSHLKEKAIKQRKARPKPLYAQSEKEKERWLHLFNQEDI